MIQSPSLLSTRVHCSVWYVCVFVVHQGALFSMICMCVCCPPECTVQCDMYMCLLSTRVHYSVLVPVIWDVQLGESEVNTLEVEVCDEEVKEDKHKHKGVKRSHDEDGQSAFALAAINKRRKVEPKVEQSGEGKYYTLWNRIAWNCHIFQR